MMKITCNRMIYAALLTAALTLAAPGCAAENAGSSTGLPLSAAPSAAESFVVSTAAEESTSDADMYKPDLFKDGDTAEYHYDFRMSSGLRIDIVFPCKGCEVEISTSDGYIMAAGEGVSSFSDGDRFKELRYTIGQDYNYVCWYPLQNEEPRTYNDHTLITFTVYEAGEPTARGEIEAVKTAEQPMRDINYELTLRSFELFL